MAWEEEDIRQMTHVQKPYGRREQEAFKELKEIQCVWSTESMEGYYAWEAGSGWIHGSPLGSVKESYINLQSTMEPLYILREECNIISF